MKALLVEPESGRRHALAEVLRRQGFELAMTEEIEVACALQRAEGFPLIVLMADPWEKGTELCRRLRDVACERPSWILASIDGSPADCMHDLLAAGADDVLPLPLEERHLEARVALAKRRAESWCPAASPDGPSHAEETGNGAQDALQRSEVMFRSLVENMSDLVFILDADGFIRFANCLLHQSAGEELQGGHCSKYFAAGHVQPLLSMTKRALDTRRAQILPVADRWGRWWESRIVPLVQAGSADTALIICTDMSERQQAVDLLRESEQRYRLIAENVSDLIWIAEFEQPLLLPAPPQADAVRQLADEMVNRWRFTYASPSVERALGYPVREFLSLGLETLLAAESCDLIRQLLAEELVHETRSDKDLRRSRMVEIRQRTKNGPICHGEAMTTFLRNADGEITGVLGVTRDITQRRQAEDALRESEAALRGLVQNMPDLVIVVDRNGVVQYANRGVNSPGLDSLIGRLSFDYIQPECCQVGRSAIQRAWETREVQQCEVLDISGNYWSCRMVPIVEDDKVQRAMVICTDVTEAKLAEAEVQREQELLRQLLELFERDRELAAFEIHDGVAQQLTGALLNFEASGQLAASPDESKRTYREGLRLLRQSIEEARRLVSGLRPPVLDSFGIVPAIEQLIRENLALGAPEIELVAAQQVDRLARPLENAVFRIVQESLTNARRHSQTKKIYVELGRTDDRVQLVVRDWGIGFNPAHVSTAGFGVKGIRERARLLGGTAAFDTAPGKGTTVVVELPLLLRTSDSQ